MQLETISIENYRSITKARQLRLSSNTVLIGPNNEGKSNILRALSAAMFALTSRQTTRQFVPSYEARRLGLEGHRFRWDQDHPVQFQNKKGSTSKILLEFKLSDAEVEDFRREIKSNLNGSLPVEITFFRDEIHQIKIVKQGRGSKTLNQKSRAITRFLGERIAFQYIPAVRTATQAVRIVEGIVAEQLSLLEKDPKYRQALETVKNMQKPILEELSQNTAKSLQSFLPHVSQVNFRIDEARRYSALRHNVDISINDGTETPLEAKGDGVQSLVALGLRRHLLEEHRANKTYIFAIEEPEAHLHPDAIYALKGVIEELSEVDQIIITTHNGILAKSKEHR